MWSSFTATIAINASLSDAIHVPPGYAIVGIQLPAAWTAAGLSFQAAAQAAHTFVNLYDSTGAELTCAADISRIVAVDPLDDGLDYPFLKIRSGTSGTPVVQAAARSIIVHFGKRT